MTDVAVIGCGINGLLTAYELASRGVSVEVFERGECGRESTWAGGGILSPLYPWRYPDAVTELARWSQEHYKAFADELCAETGIDPEWTQSGLLMLDVAEEECRQASRWAKQFGYRLEYLGSDAVAELSPGIVEASGVSLWMPEVAQIRNPCFFKALKAASEKKGVVIREQTPVTDIVRQGAAVSGVRSHGEVVPAGSVMICGGAWSGELAEMGGISLPIRPVRGQMLLFRTEPGLLKQIVLSSGYYLIPRRDGRILAGSTLEEVGFDKATTDAARQELLGEAWRILPALREAEVERQWAGLRPGSPQGIPFIGEVPGIEGLYVNAGQYRNGVVTGLASARVVVDMFSENPGIVERRFFEL